MEVADGEKRGSGGIAVNHFGDDLHPAVEGRSEESERGGAHLLVLEVKVWLDQGDVLAEPLFVSVSCLFDVHGLIRDTIAWGEREAGGGKRNVAANGDGLGKESWSP